MDFSSAAFWAGLGSIIIANILLSGDNAVVIALAARSLPAHQQKKAILFGSGAAIVLRILLTVVAAAMLRLPFLKIIGGLLLLYIGVDLLGHGRSPKPHDPAAYADLTAGVLEALPAGPVDAVGFSVHGPTVEVAAVEDRLVTLRAPAREPAVGLLGADEAAPDPGEEVLRVQRGLTDGQRDDGPVPGVQDQGPLPGLLRAPSPTQPPRPCTG